MNRDEIVSFPERGGEASHLTYEEMEAYLDSRADRIDGELAQGHLSLCARCAAEVEDLRRVRESVAPRRRWWIAAAAAAVLIAVLTIALPERHTAPAPLPTATSPQAALPPAPPAQPETPPPTLSRPAILAALVLAPRTLRGTGERSRLRLQAPVATVVLETRPRFRWTAAEGAAEYTVAVADHETGAGAASGSTTATWWQPEKPLLRGRTYTWQVTAHAGEERWIVPQPADAEVRFHVASPATVKEIEAVPAHQHLERGIALAERGILDDAERELRQAAEEGSTRAEALLEQVQSWRPW